MHTTSTLPSVHLSLTYCPARVRFGHPPCAYPCLFSHTPITCGAFSIFRARYGESRVGCRHLHVGSECIGEGTPVYPPAHWGCHTLLLGSSLPGGRLAINSGWQWGGYPYPQACTWLSSRL